MVATGANTTVFVGSANGGVWRTTDGTAASPEWTPVTDNQPVQCSSIAALTVAGSASQTIFAGYGEYIDGVYGTARGVHACSARTATHPDTFTLLTC